jgi:hypothetical protein
MYENRGKKRAMRRFPNKAVFIAPLPIGALDLVVTVPDTPMAGGLPVPGR